MQKQIHNEDYFGTLMSVLVDESRRMMPTFNPTKESHKIQNDMCKAGTWLDQVPILLAILYGLEPKQPQ